MPDISMCRNESCTLRESCYRFMATPNPYRQSYGAFKQTDDEICEYYWPMKSHKDEEDKRDNQLSIRETDDL